jgi:hypothetical protein
MSNPDALWYFKNVTYNFSTWGEAEPVNLDYEGARYHGMLKGHSAPYTVDLVEVIENGASRRIPKRTIQLDSLEGVHFLHVHGH